MIEVVEAAHGRSFREGVLTRRYLLKTDTPFSRVAIPGILLCETSLSASIGEPGPDKGGWVVDRRIEPAEDPCRWTVEIDYRQEGSPIPVDEFARRMKAILDEGEDVDCHIDGDALLCVQLRLLGYGAAVEHYEELNRWFE